MKKENVFIQHLKTYKKYNTLKNEYETLRNELDHRSVKIRILEKQKEVQEKMFEEALEEKEIKIIKLLEERARLKKQIKEMKKCKD